MMRARTHKLRQAVLTCVISALGGVTACGGGGAGADAAPAFDADERLPFYPADYVAAGYAEVRDCRGSGDHDLSQIRVLASPEAIAAYTDRTPFPAGSILLKEEYDFSDDTCVGPITQFAVMRLDATATDTLGWNWQRTTVDHTVLSQDDSRCYGCHEDCLAPEGFEFTCAVP